MFDKKEYLKEYYKKNREKIKTWREANREKVKAAQKVWREANPEKAKAIHKAWVEANPEKSKAIHKVWVEANREKVKTAHKAWYEANPEKTKAWREANREKIKAANKACRQTKVAIIYSITNIITGKVYIGSTKQKLQTRWIKHNSAIKKYPHLPLYSDMVQFGIDNFKIEELGICAKFDAFKCEQMQIDEFRSNGYNLYNSVRAAARNT